jgi:predicted site-specific integrase-resolvase
MAAITIVKRPMILYTEAETAKILRVSVRTLQRWREIGVGPAFTQPRKGGRITYSDEAIKDYVATHTYTSTAAADAEEVGRNG